VDLSCPFSAGLSWGAPLSAAAGLGPDAGFRGTAGRTAAAAFLCAPWVSADFANAALARTAGAGALLRRALVA